MVSEMWKLLLAPRFYVATLIVVISLLVAGVNSAESAETTIDPWASASTDFPSSVIPHDSAVTPGERTGGVVWSRHNLSTYGPVFQSMAGFNPVPAAPWVVAWTTQTTQVCVFCHTPHHARTDTAPLWNKDNLATYTAYGSTVAGTSTSVSGSSLACLSCHDGVTTFDNIINRPGKGSGSPTGVAGDTTNDKWMGWQMWGVDGSEPPSTYADHFRASSGSCSDCHPQSESDRLNIGLGPTFNIVEDGFTFQPQSGVGDLQNDHPIGVPYETDGRASLRATSTVLSSLSMAQANTVHGSGDVTAEFGRSDNYWSVFGYIKGDATIADLLRGGNMVECASCHDPHYKNQTNNDPSLIESYNRTGGVVGPPGSTGYNYTVSGQFDKVIDGLFLRRVGGNSNSGVCRTCHAK